MSISNRLQWPGLDLIGQVPSGQQSPAQRDGRHQDENSDDGASITQSEMASELELLWLMAEHGFDSESRLAPP